MKPCLLIIDGSNFLFRAYHALPPLTNSVGQPTGAIRGTITMLQKLLNDFKPSHVAVTFDHKGHSFRNALYPDYKAHRPPMPDDLRVQIAPLHEIVVLLGLQLIIIEDIEADDAIATLATRGKAANMLVVIASSDKDLAQLVEDDTILFDGMKNQKIDREGVFEKYGVYPELIRDYLALMGDTSDNIPGITGVGPKTAAKWLNEYGSLDNLIKNADKIGGKIGEKLRAGLSILPLSKQLTTLVCDAKIPFELSALIPKSANIAALKTIYQQLEFRQLINQLDGIAALKTDNHSTPNAAVKSALSTQSLILPPSLSQSNWVKPTPPITKKYHIITNELELTNCINHIRTGTFIAIDTETNSLDYMSADLVGISLSVASGEAFYIPIIYTAPATQLKPKKKQISETLFPNEIVDNDPTSIASPTESNQLNATTDSNLTDLIDLTNIAPTLLPLDFIIKQLKPTLEDPKIRKVGQHIKFDWHILNRHGILLNGIAHDTMLMSYVLNPTGYKHNLDALAAEYLGQTTTTFESIAGKGAKQITFDQIPIKIAGAYACEDADITLQLSRALLPQLASEPALYNVYETIEIPTLMILAKMEHRGILLDIDHLLDLNTELNQRISLIESEAYTLAGETFNLGSSKQLADILFDKMKLPILKKTPKGAPSTAEEVLETLALDYPLPKLLIAHRELSKLNSTYTLSLIAQVNPETKRIHTSYNQALTSTGRLSSSGPNLQNIPIKTAEGRRIRQAFIAKPGYVLMSADYSQIELRLMAHFSKDEALINAFIQGEDIHKATASEVFQTPLNTVTPEQRRSAKAINFGLIYGMGAFGLARQLGISRKDAQDYIARYFGRFTGVLAYMEQAKIDAKNLGYVSTLSGRRLYLPEINSAVAMIRAGAERLAINAPLQGTAADIIKLAMIKVDHALSKPNLVLGEQLDAHVLLQVHDELVLEVKETHIDAAKALLHANMTTAFQLDVPLDIEIGVGFDWDEAH